MTDKIALASNIDQSLRFLSWAHPNGPWTLTAIPVGRGRTTTATFHDINAAKSWLVERSGRQNIYWTVNRLRGPMDIKPKKEHIEEAVFLHVDLDPVKPVGIAPDKLAKFNADEQARILKLLEEFSPSPSAITFSGGGYQAFWRLDEPLYVGGDDNRIADLEAYNKQLAIVLGGDNTHNIDRIMRVPGTINVPDEKKRKKGRVEALATIVEMSDVAYPLHDFTPVLEVKSTKGSAPIAGDRPDPIRLNDPAELDQWEVPMWARVVIVEGTDPTDPNRWDGDRSAAQWAVTCELARRRVPTGMVVGILTDNAWGISAHVLDQKRPLEYAWRQVEKACALAEADGEPFQTDKDGKPYPNQHNIRLALSKLGAVVRHDVFADRMLIEGLDGCGPNLDDAALDRLWLDIDARYSFRPTWEFFVKVVIDTARRSAFHPVRDYLAKLTWDRVPRVDGWLTTYGGAVDSPYTRAVGALMLIAAVRRVRQPGVKFDEMLVMESKQGTNKSSALRVLATRDEWFIDDLPLNAESKVVIERLSGRWIAEAAELKGMRKGEVEHLKGFLSRQHDTARMVYARLPVIVPRQCVIFGTTNSERYLRDLTGNRRFWPVSVEGFDLDRLCADVDQLWAEAAGREAAGESIRLDPALWGDAELEQDARRIEDPFTLALAAAIGEQNGKISGQTVWGVLRIPAGQQTQDHNARVGEAMRELGFHRKKLRFGGSPEWGYVRGTEAEQSQLIVIDEGRGEERYGEPY